MKLFGFLLILAAIYAILNVGTWSLLESLGGGFIALSIGLACVSSGK